MYLLPLILLLVVLILLSYHAQYNWELSIVHLLSKSGMPHRVFIPSDRQARRVKDAKGSYSFKGPFVGESYCINQSSAAAHDKGYGGWSHPKDISHCMELWKPGS